MEGATREIVRELDTTQFASAAVLLSRWPDGDSLAGQVEMVCIDEEGSEEDDEDSDNFNNALVEKVKPVESGLAEEVTVKFYGMILADVSFQGSPCALLIASLTPPKHQQGLEDPACEANQLQELQERLDLAFHDLRAKDAGTWMWPLHDRQKSLKLLETSALEDEGIDPIPVRVFKWLHIQKPTGPILEYLRNCYGDAVTYAYFWDCFYVQQLWLLALFTIIFVLLGSSPTGDERERFVWEIFNYGTLVWGFFVLVESWNRGNILETREGEDLEDEISYVRNPDYEPSLAPYRVILIIFVALPLFVVFMALSSGIIMAVLQFNAWLAFDWGDCIELGCRDPQEKHGFRGWLAEVGSDIALALIFEGLLALAGFLGGIIASICNHKLLIDHKHRVSMVAIGLESVGKIAPFIILGLVFATQWYETEGTDKDADCSHIWEYRIIGKSAFRCLNLRVPMERRREVYYLMMTGPFIVAPFIAILIKVVIPYVVANLECLSSHNCCLFRIIGLIFEYDGSNIGGFSYIFKGWPYTELAVKPSPPGPYYKEFLASDALDQKVLKKFSPQDELLEVQLSFLLVLFFAPIRPVGVIFTLLARILEIQSDVAKMLYTRRRVFPQKCLRLHRLQREFIATSVVFKLFWALTLTFVAYNDDLPDLFQSCKQMVGLK